MKISEVERLTGLTAKAIRLYETKGLLDVNRTSNTYREYDFANVERLSKIKALRELGVSLSDISLYFSGIHTLSEMIAKRKKEIEHDKKRNEQQYRQCIELLENAALFPHGTTSRFDEVEASEQYAHSDCLALGIDIGTSTISLLCIDVLQGRAVETFTLRNQSGVLSDGAMDKEQDPQWIAEVVLRTVDVILRAYPTIKAIGVTGQMHGILYLDAAGRAVSNLYTWQDYRAGELCEGEKTYCDIIMEKTGMAVYPGYGLATHYDHIRKGSVPQGATTFCTIADYMAMVLTGRTEPLMHASNAASLGLFSIARGDFHQDALASLGMTELDMPPVTNQTVIVGQHRGIPVAVALGDNQACVLGSLQDEENSIHVNYGTGSQISLVTDHLPTAAKGLELRPYRDGKYLLCGAALCGGSAYALLERFFRSYASLLDADAGSQYEVMNSLAENALEEGNALPVQTLFSGTREEPEARGSITGIGETNFTPAALTLGVLQGMVNELYAFYQAIQGERRSVLVASGNAVQRNPVLRKLLSSTFSMSLQVPVMLEEAALGAAMFAALAGGLTDERGIKAIIRYQ
ncbi:MAG: MerR family transcriptional regulator [Clostridia bacterium]|nr:MerR family transcriptional regulator [Clostridia bacterium]